ncbi:UDP-glycosyltransferase-28, partial [Frankliniella occidentalis]
MTVELAKRGHLVTSIDIHKHSENPPTLNTSIIETAFRIFDDPEDMGRWFAASVVQKIGIVQSLLEEDCKRDLGAPAMQRLLDPAFKGAFDLIIIDYQADCMLGFAHRFNYPGMLAVSPFPSDNHADRCLQDLRKWMDEAEDGFVFVSFGSI